MLILDLAKMVIKKIKRRALVGVTQWIARQPVN